MTKLQQFVLRVKTYLLNISKYYNPESPSFIKIPTIKDMTTRKIDDNNEPPNKKLCTEEEKEETVVENNSVKIKKVKVVLLLAYSGADYWGMQRNAGVKTIEGELVSALHKANLIPPEALDDLHVIKFQRAARTDKGVSAAQQIVSLKIGKNFNISTINSYLPEEIRVLSAKRVTKGFNSKNDCNGRTYSYTLPTFALAPELHEEYPENYRIDKKTLDQVNTILNSFLGTHNFHNFTSGKHFRDPSAKRFIMSFKAGEPFVDGDEFITLTVRGQSFMLHQIRKMVGHMISILKKMIPPYIETDVWNDKKYSVPMAPGLGLVLENVHYDRYNRKFGNDGIHESLTWDEVNDEIESFRKKYILGNIIKKEKEEKSMFNWIWSQRMHVYDYSEEKNVIDGKLEETSNSTVSNEATEERLLADSKA